jgi:hypothetical protein
MTSNSIVPHLEDSMCDTEKNSSEPKSVGCPVYFCSRLGVKFYEFNSIRLAHLIQLKIIANELTAQAHTPRWLCRMLGIQSRLAVCQLR